MMPGARVDAAHGAHHLGPEQDVADIDDTHQKIDARLDRKSTRLNSSHLVISYAVFCLKKKKAVHSISVFNPKATANETERAYGRNPSAFVIIIKSGPSISHLDITANFNEMENIREQY